MGKYFLTTRETLRYIYEIEAGSVESAIKVYKDANGICGVFESKIISDEIISVSKCKDEDEMPMRCDHCGTKLTEGTMNYVGTKNGKKFYICNKCLDKSFTNEEWDSLVELTSRI